MKSLSTRLGMFRSIAIYYGMPWRRRSLARFYKELVPANSLVFDIGAHVGSRTRSLLANGAHCVAIEPQPAFAELLRRQFSNNKRVSLVTQAVGREHGEADLLISSRHPTVTTLSANWVSRVAATSGFETVNWDQRVTVAVTTLDSLIATHGLPVFCKIDVEGMEAEILAGLSTAIPIVAVEYIPATIDIALSCVKLLEKLGDYQYNLSAGETHSMHFGKWIDAETLSYELNQIATTASESGDLYARLVNQSNYR